MQYSPKLKKAMEEIKKILSKHDIAGLVVLHTPGHAEFINRLDPSYSCCKVSGDEIRVKSKLEDYSGNKILQQKHLSDTSNMLHSITHVTGTILLPLMDLSTRIDKLVDAKHEGDGFSSHTTQNN